MSQRFQFSLRWLLGIACVVGAVLVPIVVDTVPLVLDVVAGRVVRRPALFARLHDTGIRTAALLFVVAVLAALFVVIKLWRLQGRPSKK